jgi:hypothetical protein
MRAVIRKERVMELSFTISLNEELWQRLKQDSSRQGLSPHDWALRTLEAALPATAPLPAVPLATPMATASLPQRVMGPEPPPVESAAEIVNAQIANEAPNFNAVAGYVLRKNAELYRRLA